MAKLTKKEIVETLDKMASYLINRIEASNISNKELYIARTVVAMSIRDFIKTGDISFISDYID